MAALNPGHRTAIATALVIAAIAVPCGAWYLVGSREAGREATRVRERPQQDATETARRIADHLTVRLEALREAESRRPFFHYQSHFHDPLSDCECASITSSPLAVGSNDPLVWTYFQIDPLGQLTLPTLNEEQHREHGAVWLGAQAEILERLIPAVPACLADHPGTDRTDPPAVSPAGWTPDAGTAREEVVAETAWAINMQICGIRTDPLAVPVAGVQKASLGSPKGDGAGRVRIDLEPLGWRSVPVGGRPALAGLRRVATPIGIFVQGFVVDTDAVEASIRGSGSSVRWEPGPPSEDTEVAVVLAGATWHVGIPADAAEAAAAEESGRIMNRFRRTFLGGTVAAILAGIGVIALVGQSDRLARQRSRFAASAAHELRTPLAGLRMYGDMLADELGDPDKTRAYARHISSEAERLGRVVNNVMSYARLERGEVAARPAPGDLGAAVGESLASLRPALDTAGARLVPEIAAGVAAVFDRDAVFQIVHNLVDNAAKHARDAGDRTITVVLEEAGGKAVLSVTDRGPGVPPSLRRRLFEPFQRGEADDAPAGLGLGLALVRALAEAQDGEAGYEDAPGGGAVFSVRLPLAR